MKHALRLIVFFTILLTGFFSYERSFGQTVTFNPQTTNLTTGTLTGYSSNNVAVYGFSLTVSGAPETIGTVNIKDNVNGGANNLANTFNNGRLYSTSTSGYNASSPGTQVGTVTFGTGLITISNMNESIAVGETRYYYLVVDCIATTNTAFQPFIGYGQSPVGIISSGGTNYNNNNNGYENYYNIAAGTPPPFVINNLTGGLTANTTTLIPGQSGVVVFGFSIKTTANYPINQININSTSNLLSSYIASAVLYRNTTNDYATGTKTAVGTATISTDKITINGNESINQTTRYYFLVVTLQNSFPAQEDIQFYFESGQNPAAFVRNSGNPKPGNTWNTSGPTYNLNASRLTVTSQQTGVSAATITAKQTDVALFGFGIQSTNAITISQININSNNANADEYFGNGKLYYSVNNSYTPGAETLAGTVAFNGRYANVTLTAQNTFTANQTRYYFLVADNIGGAASATITFNFTTGQSEDAIVQSSPINSTYNTFAVTGNTFNLPAPTIFVTGANSVANGITQGILAFGQTNIVLFGFGVEGFGDDQTFIQINIKTSGMENQYFSNGRLYRSATNVFPGGSPLYSGANINIAGGGYVVCTVNETIPAGTTYYYWLVADYTVNTGPPNAAYTFGFQSGQGQLAFIPTPYSTAYNTFNVTGQAFNIATTLDWVGGTSSSFTDANNFKTLNNSNGTVPISTTIVRVGGRAYTNAPVIAANTTIGGLTFGSVVASPVITINSGNTLTLNSALNVLANATGTITGPGAVTIGASAISNVNDGATLNINGGATLSNAGTFTAASTSILNVTGSSTLANTGTFTLQSNGSGSATVGPVTGSITGNYNVERYITGGQSWSRGYRLLSSPVSVSAASLIWPNLTFIHSKTYTTGTGGTTNGFDAVGNPNMYLYRENRAPDFSTFISGNSRGISKINNTTASSFNLDGETGTFNIRAGNGLLLFFRGDRATTTNPTNTSSIAQPTTFTQTGYLNQGNIVVRNWFTPASTNLSYTAATPVSVRGFNFVGNPYASAINWNNVSFTNLDGNIWVYNPKLKVYATYSKSTGLGVNFNGSPGNIIPSGQGFYVKATSTAATLTFAETNKVNTQTPQSGLLLATAPVNTANVQYLRLQLTLDSLNKDESLIVFSDTSSTNFSANEDAEYLSGVGQVNLSTKAADNTVLAINQLPFPAKSEIIPLNVNVPADGNYKIEVPELQNIPQLYRVWLKDAFRKDSLNLKGTNPVYNFNAVLNDTTTFKNRFSVVIGIDGNYTYQLIDFTATKQTTSVKVAWVTVNESNNTYFTVERSTDGVNYTTIGTLRSNGQGNYEFVDNTPELNGKNFYRLRQEDFKGVITYSTAIPITFVSGNNVTAALISLFPNPSSNTINITIDQIDPNITPLYTITITGSSGTTLNKVSISKNSWQGDISKLLPGTYYVQVINETNKKVIGKTRFIKL
ncbi:MAG: hypothetical protein EOP47_05350 [Sphingobacteriaceae bacterium]|nr:MAG: hypothetical protein EOP47_05350 [Sphingobacteriaceae bacterium]